MALFQPSIKAETSLIITEIGRAGMDKVNNVIDYYVLEALDGKSPQTLGTIAKNIDKPFKDVKERAEKLADKKLIKQLRG